jgi:phosphoribosylformylglycinamidine synthase
MKVLVGILTQSSIPDPVGESLAGRLAETGYQEVVGARVGKIVELTLDGADETSIKSRIDRMCKSLLTHPNAEEYEVLKIIEEEQ